MATISVQSETLHCPSSFIPVAITVLFLLSPTVNLEAAEIVSEETRCPILGIDKLSESSATISGVLTLSLLETLPLFIAKKAITPATIARIRTIIIIEMI